MRKFFIPTATVAVAIGLISLAYAADKAKIGSAAPSFSLQDTSGKTQSLADYKGKIVVLEWINPGCPYVQRHYNLKTMTTLATKNKDVAWLAVATGATADADSLKSFADKNGISYPILLDSDGTVGKEYNAKTTPHMFIIDKEGKLAYAGGIDDQPNQDPNAPLKDGTVNYVEKALSELQAGQSVSTSETKAYGCSVKYKK